MGKKHGTTTALAQARVRKMIKKGKLKKKCCKSKPCCKRCPIMAFKQVKQDLAA